MHSKRGNPTDVSRARLESLLIEFDRSWTPSSLSSELRQLPRGDETLRRWAIIELIKVDLEHWWRSGRERTVEDYLGQLPELGTPDTVSAELIQAEYEIRQQCGSPIELADLGRRFPVQLQRVKELIDAAGQPSAAEPVQATIDTSRPGVADTEAGQPASQVPLPEQFGRYRIIRRLGAGAMGAVYLAHDTQLDRQVALKTPSFGGDPDPELIKRFYREAQSAATLRHPNICPVHDVGEIDQVHFITMAYIEGRPLSAFIRPEKLVPQRTAATLVRKLALALHHAHESGVVHRDLKPANIMVDRSREPIVMDFGLARRTDTAEQSRMTQSGMILGTPAYMSTEQVDGDHDKIGPLSDQYSLGIILYELLTAKLPFRGTVASVIAQIMTKPASPPHEHRPDLDESLEAICMRMICKDQEQRYPSMLEAAAALAAFLKGKPQPAPGRADLESDGRTPNRSPSSLPEIVVERPDQVSTRLQTRKASAPQRPKLATPPAAIAAGVLGLVALVVFGLYLFSKDGDEASKSTVATTNASPEVTAEAPVGDESVVDSASGSNAAAVPDSSTPQLQAFSGTLAGTTWAVTDSDGDAYEFSFLPDGVLHYETDRGRRVHGTWVRQGENVSITTNAGYSNIDGVLSAGQMSGKGVSRAGDVWTWEAKLRSSQ